MPTLASHADKVEKVSSSGSPLAKPRIKTKRTRRSVYSASERCQLRSFPLRFRTERFLSRLGSLELRTQLPRPQATLSTCVHILPAVFWTTRGGRVRVPHRLSSVRIRTIAAVGQTVNPGIDLSMVFGVDPTARF